MDIHPPERPIHSAKDFLLQLMTITIGILIALSLEGVLQWSHHRTLVREAKARLSQEIQDNRREANDFLKRVPAMNESNQKVLQLIDDVAAKKPLKNIRLGASYKLMSLARTGWDTAQATGALAYMEYTEAQSYSTVYAGQARLEEFQDRLLHSYIAGLLSPINDPDRASASELRAWRQNVVVVSQYVDALRQLTEQLIEEYDKVLPASR